MDDQNKSVNERWAPPTESPERGYATDPGFASSDENAPGPDYARTENRDTSSTGRRTTEIRQEIDETRADMSETIDAIQDRLKPRNVAARAAESVHDATVGRVKEFASGLTGRNRSQRPDDDWRYRSSGWHGTSGNGIVDRIRDNPFAAAVAAGSIAWLIFGGRRRTGFIDKGRDRAIYGSTRGTDPFVRETRIDVDEAPESYGESTRRDWEDSRSGGGADWAQTGRDMTERAREAVFDAGERIRYAASDVQRRSRGFASHSPLATGAIAAGLGLAIGLTIPETERENEILGEVRDSVIDRGKDAVRTAAERVQSAAGEVQRVAGDALKGIAPAGSSQAGNQRTQNSESAATLQSTTASQSTTMSAVRAGEGTGVGESGTEQPVPGTQVGSGGTGAIPTTSTKGGRSRTR